MSDTATATVVDVDDLAEHGNVANVYTSKDGYNPGLRFFYIAGLVESNNYINTYNFSGMELKACKTISDSEVYLDDLLYIDWESENISFELTVAEAI